MSDYPDSNNNGIPDAFENRASITEILNDDAAEIRHKTFVERITPRLSPGLVESLRDRMPIDKAHAEYQRLERNAREALAALEEFKQRIARGEIASESDER